MKYHFTANVKEQNAVTNIVYFSYVSMIIGNILKGKLWQFISLLLAITKQQIIKLVMTSEYYNLCYAASFGLIAQQLIVLCM